MQDKARVWLDAVFDLQTPQDETLVVSFDERNRILEALQTQSRWDETEVVRDTGGKYTGHGERYNRPRTIHTFLAQSSCEDGRFLQVKLTYGRNDRTPIAWLSYKLVDL